MNVRKLLQTELWSKETSRKILVGVAIFTGALVVTYGIWYEVETHWSTDRERAAAKVALQRIDALQHADSLSNAEFKIRTDEVETALNAAEIAARTKKDELISIELMMCSMGAESARLKTLKQSWIQQGKIHESTKDREFDDQMQRLTDTVVNQSCSQLHKELN